MGRRKAPAVRAAAAEANPDLNVVRSRDEQKVACLIKCQFDDKIITHTLVENRF